MWTGSLLHSINATFLVLLYLAFTFSTVMLILFCSDANSRLQVHWVLCSVYVCFLNFDIVYRENENAKIGILILFKQKACLTCAFSVITFHYNLIISGKEHLYLSYENTREQCYLKEIHALLDNRCCVHDLYGPEYIPFLFLFLSFSSPPLPRKKNTYPSS